MAKRSKRHEVVQSVSMVLNGGLNYAQTPSNIADNEVFKGQNFIYDPSTDFLITRPGTSCKTALVCDGANPILAIHYYEKSTSTAYLVAACNGNLYYLSGAGLDAWTLIGALADTTTVPSFLTYNTKLLIADGGQHIKRWDGVTYDTLDDGLYATALAEIKGRVVANSTASGGNDLVTLTGPEDETAWNTATEGAVAIRAGFGDNMAVNEFDVFGDDLIISKKGYAQKRIYRINVASATTTDWYSEVVSINNAAQNTHSMVAAWNNVFFVDTNGFKSIRGVADYGDLQVDAIGNKVNTLFTAQNSCDFCTFVPAYNAIWFGMGDRVFCYTERAITTSEGAGAVTPAFTELLFKQGRIRSICQADTVVYLAGHDGFLYKLDESLATDATDASTSVAYPSNVRTKTIAFGVDGILKKCQWYLRPKGEGLASILVYTSEETGITLKSVTLLGEGTYLYDATGYLADATGYLYDDGAAAWVETSRNRVRATQMAFELLVASGRVGVEWVKADFALVEGGE